MNTESTILSDDSQKHFFQAFRICLIWLTEKSHLVSKPHTFISLHTPQFYLYGGGFLKMSGVWIGCEEAEAEVAEEEEG